MDDRFRHLLARDLIIIVPLLIVGLWLWGRKASWHRSAVVAKTTIALLFAMLAAATIGALLPHERPFVAGVGYTFRHMRRTARSRAITAPPSLPLRWRSCSGTGSGPACC